MNSTIINKNFNSALITYIKNIIAFILKQDVPKLSTKNILEKKLFYNRHTVEQVPNNIFFVVIINNSCYCVQYIIWFRNIPFLVVVSELYSKCTRCVAYDIVSIQVYNIIILIQGQHCFSFNCIISNYFRFASHIYTLQATY